MAHSTLCKLQNLRGNHTQRKMFYFLRNVNITSSISADCEERVLYKNHTPTSRIQKFLLSLGSSVLALRDPYRYDMVAVFGETTGYFASCHIRNRMLLDPEGKHILSEKPRIRSENLDFEYLQSLPSDTFGHAYIRFLTDNNVSPDTRNEVRFVDDAELAYVVQRYREVHDLMHTLLGMPTNLLGEVAVKWVEGIQNGLPMCIMGALLAPLRLHPRMREKYVRVYLPWAVECGTKAKFLMNVYFERRWHQSLEVLRRDLRIPPPPSLC